MTYLGHDAGLDQRNCPLRGEPEYGGAMVLLAYPSCLGGLPRRVRSIVQAVTAGTGASCHMLGDTNLALHDLDPDTFA